MEERPKKRRMHRRPQRRAEEFEKRTGKSYAETTARLRDTITKKNARIAVLTERLSKIRDEHNLEIHKLKILHRRDLRKENTKFSNLDSKFKDFKKKKGERNRVVIYKNKYKTYETPSTIKTFEKLMTDVKDLPEDYLTMFERLIKINQFLEDYNKENNTQLNYQHYIILLNLTFTRGRLQGVTAPKLVIPMMSQHMIRKSLNYLSDQGLCTKVNRISFRISMVGDKLLKDLKNFNSYGKSEVIEHIKKVSRLKDEGETDYENL